MPDRSPAIDITSLAAVESLFRTGTRDPWAAKLAGRLADFFIFSERARFTMPVADGDLTGNAPLPSILVQLRSRDPGILEPIVYPVQDRRQLGDEHLHPAFDCFAKWALNNGSALRTFLKLHNEPWIREGIQSNLRWSVFDIGVLRQDAKFRAVAAALKTPPDDLIYAFDVVLRYPLYAELVGEGAYYLAHPIREKQSLPILSIRSGLPPAIPLSLSQAVAAMSPSMTLDEYTSFLHEARGVIMDRKINQLEPGALTRDATREIAAQLGLPARIRKTGKAMGIAAGLIGVVGLVPEYGVPAALAGCAVSVLSAVWSGNVGRAPARITWLRWALEWEMESQASDTDS